MHSLNPRKKLTSQSPEISPTANDGFNTVTNNTEASKVEKVTYPFVDLIRFVSTFGIVFIHSEFLFTQNPGVYFHKVNHIEYYFAMRNVFKFATICYFLIAGFLLAGKIEKTERLNYFMRRLRVLARPYLFAMFIFLIGFVYVAHQKITPSFLYESIKYIVCYTSFWYVPNYLICLVIIITCSKYTHSIFFGIALLIITLWYTYSTVYATEHTSSHTTALFGFVFYMWLGMYVKRTDLVSKIQNIKLSLLIGVVVLIFAFSNYETWYLFNFTHTHDSQNTLRIGNQLYSVAIFALMIKVCNKTPNFGIFRPRQETYGIYLYHCFFIFFFIPVVETGICNYYHFTLFSYNVIQLIIINLINFILCYFATTFTVKALIKFKLAFLPYE